MTPRPDFFEAHGWRYAIQREHWLQCKPYYSLYLAPPDMPVGYIGDNWGKIERKLYPIVPTLRETNGTRSGVVMLIRRHMAYVEKTLRAAIDN